MLDFRANEGSIAMKEHLPISILLFFCVVLALPVSAQEVQSYEAAGQEGQAGDVPVNGDEGIALGPFIFSPALELTWQYRDNIYFAPPEFEEEDEVYLARARLRFELPVYDSYIRFTYTPQWRDYAKYPWRDKWAHFADVSGAFEFASGWKVSTGYKFLSGAMETREVDPGGEYMWGEREWDKHYFQLQADYWFSATDGLSLEGDLADLTFEDPPVSDYAFHDYSQYAGGIGWLHQISPTAVMDIKYRHGEYDAEDPVGYRDNTSDELDLGFRGQLTELLSSEVSFGWRESEYDVRPGDPEIENYSSLVVRGGLGYELSESSNLRLDMIRTDYSSTVGENAYYTATGASLIYTLHLSRLTGQLRARYQENDYDLPVEVLDEDGVRRYHERLDEILTFGLGLSIRITDLLSVRGSYLYEDRETMWPFYYETNIFVLGLVVGY